MVREIGLRLPAVYLEFAGHALALLQTAERYGLVDRILGHFAV